MSTPHGESQIRTLLARKDYSDAFELIMALFGDRMLRLAWSMLGQRTAAEDVVQDALIRIWRGLPTFRGDASLSTWIYAITRNRCLTALTRGTQRDVSLDDPGVREAAEAIPDTPRPAGEQSLLPLVDRLPPHYRQAVRLFYMEEKSYDEMARLLDLPMGTVKIRLHRGRKALAAMVRHARGEGAS